MAGKKIIETLVTELTADGAKFKKEMDDSVKHAKNWGDRIASISKGVGVGLVAGGAALAAGAAMLTKTAIDNADALFEQSQKLGMSTESLSAYHYAASMSGLTTEQFDASLNKFNRTLTDASKGVGKGAETFDLLGVKIRDSEGKMRTNSEVLIDLADAFSKLPDTAGKAALAQDIFGKSGAEMLPFLNNGADGIRGLSDEAERFGLIIDGETAKAANEFNDELDKLGAFADGVGNKLAAKALPMLRDLVTLITDPATSQGASKFTAGLVSAGDAALKYAPAFNVLAGAISAISGVSYIASSVDWFDVDEIEAQEKALARLIERAKMLYGDDFKADERFKYDPISDDIAKATIDLERFKKLKEMEAKIKTETENQPGKSAEDLIGDVDYDKNKAELLKFWDETQGREIALMMEREKKAQDLANREVVMQREKFAQIHEEMLQADNNLVDLENYRNARNKEQLAKDLESIRNNVLLTETVKQELEEEFRTAAVEQEVAHQERLKEIKNKALEEDLKRRQIQLEGTVTLFSALGDLTDAFGGRSSRARRALLIAEKAAAIASATISINEGIAKSARLGFPENIPAIASTIGATAGVIGNIEAVGIAHGGLTNVPKEQTYFLDKGERIISPKQNRDLTDFLRSPGGGSFARVEVINNISGVHMEATAEQDGDTLRLFLTAVENKLRTDLSNGRGIWREAKDRYGWSVRGTI